MVEVLGRKRGAPQDDLLPNRKGTWRYDRKSGGKPPHSKAVNAFYRSELPLGRAGSAESSLRWLFTSRRA